MYPHPLRVLLLLKNIDQARREMRWMGASVAVSIFSSVSCILDRLSTTNERRRWRCSLSAVVVNFKVRYLPTYILRTISQSTHTLAKLQEQAVLVSNKTVC